MNYVGDVNKLNPLIEHAPMRQNNINYGGLDYEYMNSFDQNKNHPVVRRVEPIDKPSNNGISRTLDVNTKQGSLEYSLRSTNMFDIFKNIPVPMVDTYTIMEDSPYDNDIVYSIPSKIGHKNSTPFSAPSRDITILDNPTRDGDTHPSVLQNRNARMRAGVGKN
tara:strand:+ start:7961 stop:8452 length:492 start_codon:yes stop_codon:yes gene_type:complete